jgi:hypothetical protein
MFERSIWKEVPEVLGDDGARVPAEDPEDLSDNEGYD